MEEKKLTEEKAMVNYIANDVLGSVKPLYLRKRIVREIFDLIRCLQSENEELRTESNRMVAEHLEFAELAKKADEQQKAEIERLTKLAELRLRDNEDSCKLLMEKEKQVDELKEWCDTTYKKAVEREEDAYSLGFDKGKEQAVKDTAKEILQKIMSIIKKSNGFLAEEVVRIIAKQKGVEVE